MSATNERQAIVEQLASMPCDCGGAFVVDETEPNATGGTWVYVRCTGKCGLIRRFAWYGTECRMAQVDEGSPPTPLLAYGVPAVQKRLSVDGVADFTEFIAALGRRLRAGEREYGESSFTRAPSELKAEIEEELLDVCGWAFLLWLRVRRVRKRSDQMA